MKLSNRFTQLATLGLTVLAYGCATTSPPPKPQTLPKPSDAEIVKVRVVVAPEVSKKIPTGSRIVITNFDGPCALEVQDALMRRLVDNADYDVLTRDHLRQILVESEQSWTGKFDSTTATRLGDLLGASLFVVGRIAYCGPSKEPLEGEERPNYSILAVLQILDLRTGKVLVSSAGEGIYTPKLARLLMAKGTTELVIDDLDTLTEGSSASDVIEDLEASSTVGGKTDSWVKKRLQQIKDFGGRVREDVSASPEPLAKDKNGERSRPVNFVAFKAAEDLANKFADKFFARPAWEDVEMWTSPEWTYGESIHFVKLGHCQRAVGLLQGSQELSSMSDLDVARHLHNLGVALLCNNEIEKAVRKLRSAYRLTYDPATLEMLELAAKTIEWSLTVEVDKEPEVGMLVERSSTAP